MLSAKRNRKAANRFFKKALRFNHNQILRVITVDKNPAYPPAIDKLKNDKILPRNVDIGQVKDLNYSSLNEAKYVNQLFGIVL